MATRKKRTRRPAKRKRARTKYLAGPRMANRAYYSKKPRARKARGKTGTVQTSKSGVKWIKTSTGKGWARA